MHTDEDKRAWREKQDDILFAQRPPIDIRLQKAFLVYYPSTCLWDLYPALEFDAFLALKDEELLRLPQIGPALLRYIARLRQQRPSPAPPGADPEWNAWADTLPAVWRSP